MPRLSPAFWTAALVCLAGCDQLGLESATQTADRREAEGKAIGGGCRHAARSVEVCYGLNKRADKAAVFTGWREMNDYMRENKLEAMPAPEPVASAPVGAGDDGDDEEEAAPPKGSKTARADTGVAGKQ